MTWDNPEELQRYIKKLQAAAETLTTENRKLRRCHITVSEKVCGHIWFCVMGFIPLQAPILQN